MIADELTIKYIGGATAYLEVAGLRFLTDPTFDPKETKYETALYVLHKLNDPAATPVNIGKIDFVLLSHDHHFDNLDNEGRKFLSSVVSRVFKTLAYAGIITRTSAPSRLRAAGREPVTSPNPPVFTRG